MKNNANLTTKQKTIKTKLTLLNGTTGQPTVQLAPMVKAAKTIKSHWQGILRWKKSQINNGILEGLNSVLQAAMRKARGYKKPHFKIIAYLLTGSKLDFSKVK